MQLTPGTVAFFREAFDGARDKFIYILGVLDPPGADGEREVQEVLWFTISSQTKWTAIHPHCNEMVEIPRATLECLDRRSFIQCFNEVQRTPLVEFRELENRGYIMYRGELPEFVPSVMGIMETSELLTDYECADVKAVLTRRTEHPAGRRFGRLAPEPAATPRRPEPELRETHPVPQRPEFPRR